MLSKIQRWGNSQGVRLPKHILDDAQMHVGDDLEIIVKEGRIALKKIEKRRFELAEMVKQMPRGYKTREESFGQPTGKEKW